MSGPSPYVFPGARSRIRPMSENAILAALRRMGFEKESVTGHGFRATARTLRNREPVLRLSYHAQSWLNSS